VVVHFGEVEHDEQLRENIETQCHRLTDEFPEITKIEIGLKADGMGFEAHGHVTGKGIDIATAGTASALPPAADLVFNKAERQLRKIHDKRIFTQRRGAKRDAAKHPESELE
jgi:ribosome-associated translation inhibitor RaiA